MLLVGWLIPVIALVLFNKFAMGSWTGYDTTNESEGFSWNYFIDKWDFMVGQVYNTGLFFVAPLGIAGMVLLYRKSARVATVMTLWFVPGILLYTAYYWGLNTNGVGYLRFFLTLFPPMIFCAAWLLDDISRRGIRRGSVAAPIMAGVVVAIAAGLNLYSSRGALERDYTIQANLADAGEHILTKTQDAYEANPARRPLLFGEARSFLNYIQYAGNYECYSFDTFTARGGNRMWRNQDPDAPNPLQKARIDAMRKLYEGKSDNDLWNQGNAIVNQALEDKRHVYAALPAPMMLGFKMRFSPKDYVVTTLEKWRDPVTMSDEGRKALLAMGPAALFMGEPRRRVGNWWRSRGILRRRRLLCPRSRKRPNPSPIRRPNRRHARPRRCSRSSSFVRVDSGSRKWWHFGAVCFLHRSTFNYQHQLLESPPTLGAIPRQRILNDRQRLGRGLDLVDFHRLAFQLLVILEKSPQHRQSMHRHLVGFGVAVELWIVCGDGDDLVIFLS